MTERAGDSNASSPENGSPAPLPLPLPKDREQLRREEEDRIRREHLNEQSKLASLGSLAGGIAHEINNPNNFILMNLPFLIELWDDARKIIDEHCLRFPDTMLAGRKYTEIRDRIPLLFRDTLEGGRRIKRIVAELRSYLGQQSSSKVQLDLNKVVDSALVIMTGTLNKHTRRFTRNAAPGLPLVMGDFQKLEQLLINLLHNAIEALSDPKQGISVSTAWRREEGWVELSVDDEGVGIPAENLPRLKEPFFTTKRESKGLGMGLPICDAIVRDHGGELRFFSTFGKGTRAVVLLPPGPSLQEPGSQNGRP